jgi:hypothetical protein
MRCEHNWSDWKTLLSGWYGDPIEGRKCPNCHLEQRRYVGNRSCAFLHEWSDWAESESMFGSTQRTRKCGSCGLVEVAVRGGAVDCRHEWGDVQRGSKGWFSDEREYRECGKCHLKVWRNKDGTWPERPRKGLGV